MNHFCVWITIEDCYFVLDVGLYLLTERNTSQEMGLTWKRFGSAMVSIDIPETK